MEIEDMHEFMNNLAKNFGESEENGVPLFDYNNHNLQPNECLYVVDLIKNNLVFCKGFENTWGYADHEITYEMLIDNVHPQDKEIVHHICQLAITHAIEHPINTKNNLLTITYRCKKKDGSFAKYLSQSVVIQTDSRGAMVGSMVKLTDISFLDSSDHVYYDFQTEGLDIESFRSRIYENNKNLFTKRETDIIHMIHNGRTNAEISTELGISEHTVATHRKNIMRKSGCHNVQDLMNFCHKKGIL
jgi:DNA-binding CsgD family transcriptional regulator